MNWRDTPASDKQLALISQMREFSDYTLPKFTGRTKGEASDYIDKWIKKSHELLYNPHEDAGDRE